MNFSSEFITRYLRDDGFSEDLLRIASIDSDSDSRNTVITDKLLTCHESNRVIQELRESKANIKSIKKPLKVAVVFAMWREIERIKKFSPNNRFGENCIRKKIRALEWLFKGTPISWKVFAVDDGCPEGSGEFVLRYCDHEIASGKLEVLFLRDGLPSNRPPLSRLRDVNQSVKFGAIIFGIQAAISQGFDIVSYTDCDNSVNLGHLGSILLPIAEGSADYSYGNRFSPDSLTYWCSSRSTDSPSAKLLIHLSRRVLNNYARPVDAPSPFKAFASPSIAEIIPRITKTDFMFDFEVLMCAMKMSLRSSVHGCVFIDSYEHSTWSLLGDAQVWHKRIHGMIDIAKVHGIELNPIVVRIISTLLDSVESVEKILRMPAPSEFLGVTDDQLGSTHVVDDSALHEIVQGVLS